MIKLAKDSISKEDISKLIKWLETFPQLTKGELTFQFEKEFSEFVGSKHAIFVNSGSSANLLALNAYLMSKHPNFSDYNKKIKVVVPAVSWATTVTPVFNFGLTPILCDSSKDNLGMDVKEFEKICKKHKPSVAIVVHVLGFPANIDIIKDICKEHNVFLIEDACESLGSRFRDQSLGTFGDMGTYSMFFGHGFSTIEGGMIVTDSDELSDICKTLRNHGWDRDLSEEKRKQLRDKYKIEDFQSLYTFYYPGFNVRSTDLQAFIGLEQLKKIGLYLKNRNEITMEYNKLIKNDYWKIFMRYDCFVSGHAYPLIFKNKGTKKKVVRALLKNEIETRPLICGSMGRQPFWIDRYGVKKLKVADEVHDSGIYVPIHHLMTKEEVGLICNTINGVLENE